MSRLLYLFFFFIFNHTATTEIYTLSLHDALPICFSGEEGKPITLTSRTGERAIIQPVEKGQRPPGQAVLLQAEAGYQQDRKSTRLNSSHSQISYAVFCLKKKKNKKTLTNTSN